MPGGEPTAVLAVRAARGEADAREALVERLAPMVAVLAHRFAGRVPAADLEQAGMLGVLKAVNGFDPSLGTAFEAYATPFAVGEMLAVVRQSTSPVRVPRAVRDIERRVNAAIDDFTAAGGRTPSVREIVTFTGLDEEDVLEALRARLLSRPVPVSELSEDVLAAEDGHLVAAERRIDLDELLAGLEPRSRRIVALRFGVGLSQREIAARVGLSQMHVSRLLRQALARLQGEVGR
ncbi:MAG: sigma-70 family RNA polymerase sigma factor [Gaiellales bacterium]